MEGGDPILAQLGQIQEQLQGVNERLDRIADQINELTTEVRMKAVDDDLGCLVPEGGRG